MIETRERRMIVYGGTVRFPQTGFGIVQIECWYPVDAADGPTEGMKRLRLQVETELGRTMEFVRR